jgi:hypothetical protein
MSENFNVNLSSMGPLVLEKKIFFFNIFPLQAHVKKNKKEEKSFLYCGPTRPPGTMILSNSLLYYVREFSFNFSSFGPGVLEKKIFEIPFPI